MNLFYFFSISEKACLNNNKLIINCQVSNYNFAKKLSSCKGRL